MLAAPSILYPGTAWYRNPEHFNVQFQEEYYAPRWISQDISYHGLICPPKESAYGYLGRDLLSWIPDNIEFSRECNRRGIATDLVDEHIMLARASGHEAPEELMQVSKDLMLDTVSCNERDTKHLYISLNKKSRAIAESNSELAPKNE